MRDVVDIVRSPDPAEMLAPWTIVARADAIPIDRGVAALIDDEPVAIFRLSVEGGDDEWYAVSHIDPVTDVPIIARGLVGSHGDNFDIPTVASPLHKRRYDLRTGACLDDDTPPLATYQLRVVDGWVLVS